MSTKTFLVTLATLTVAANAQVDGSQFGWPSFLTPSSPDMPMGKQDWSDACSSELKRDCSEDSGNRGKMFNCLLKELKESSTSSKCTAAVVARNAKTMRDVEAAKAARAAAESSDPASTSVGYSSESTVPTRPQVEAPAAPEEKKALNYRVDCVAEIDAYCPAVKASAVKGELYTCLYNVSKDDEKAQEEDENYVPKIDGDCLQAMVARYRQNVAATGGGAPAMLETCTTPYRIRSVATPTKCVQYKIGEKVNNYTPPGKMSFAECDMSNPDQQFIVRPYENGYRFIDLNQKGCLDEKMRIRDCGEVDNYFQLDFNNVAQGFIVKNLAGQVACWGGSKAKPTGGSCPSPVSAGKGKAGKAAKKKLKLSAFLVEPAFGFDRGSTAIRG